MPLKKYSDSKLWSVYIAKCANGALYTGIAADLERRLAEHNAGTGAKYTRSFGPVRLLWSARKRGRSAASKLEARLKSLTREEKLALIRAAKRKYSLPKMLKGVTKENRHSERDLGDATARETL